MLVVLLILACLFVLVGIIGCIVPVLPGPSLTWLGLLLIHFTKYAEFSFSFFVITGLITLVITFLDYVLPSWVVKKKGGSKFGERGALLGGIVGVFFGPIGILAGPFLGAFSGELLANYKQLDLAATFNVALSSFMGFLLSTGIKLVWSFMMGYWFVKVWLF